MTMLEIHANALLSSNSTYHLFLNSYTKNVGNFIYGFVEGKDDPSYYKSLIEPLIGPKWEASLFGAGGKRQVLQILSGMDWTRFNKSQVCFFVDKDLSLFINDINISAENLYITDNYSIENEITNHSTLIRTLEEVLGLSNLTTKEKNEIKSLYRSNFEKFCKSMIPIMAQIIIWKKNQETINLNKFQLKDHYFFEHGAIKIKKTVNIEMKRLSSFCNAIGLPISTKSQINKTKMEFKKHKGSEKYVRGKYLLWFFVNCALAIHKSIPRISNRFPKPPKVKIQLGLNNALVVVAPRVRIPNSLSDFIKNNYLKYISDN